MYKRKVLLVDDEEAMAEMVQYNLEKTGKFEVVVQSNSMMAVQTALEFRPDIIFLDVVMPQMDGPAVCHEMEQHEQLKKIPIIFLTGIVTEEEAERDFVGGRPFLAKPYSMQALVDCIEKTLS